MFKHTSVCGFIIIVMMSACSSKHGKQMCPFLSFHFISIFVLILSLPRWFCLLWLYFLISCHFVCPFYCNFACLLLFILLFFLYCFSRFCSVTLTWNMCRVSYIHLCRLIVIYAFFFFPFLELSIHSCLWICWSFSFQS